MFTGLIEEVGVVKSVEQTDEAFDLLIEAQTVLDGVRLGDSIAVNGACLTVTHFDETGFRVGLAPETRQRTNLKSIHAGDQVNLERALRADARLGGHMVQGHIDGVGEIAERTHDGDSLRITIKASPEITRYVVPKGYVALDGVSLTIIGAGADWFSIMLIAYTQTKIVLGQKHVGEDVNIEVDILGKYVEKFVAPLTASQSDYRANERALG